jgi:hypothetical protein
VSLPGLQINDQFIPVEEGDLDRVQNNGQHWISSLMGSREEGNERDVFDRQLPSTDRQGQERIHQTNRTSIQPMNQAQLPADKRLHSSNQSTTSRTSISAESVFTTITLPSGKQSKTGDLIRRLLIATHHHSTREHDVQCYFFRGYEGMKVWKELFFKQRKAGSETDDSELIVFGRLLGK